MNHPTDKTKSDRSTETRRSSFEKETTEKEHAKVKESIQGGHRSWMNAPVDPNSPTTKVNFPPGIEPEDAADPGRATPGAPPVDNRSGKRPK
ncbi:hypothetical protein [Parapusillimonas granuli]|uniref:Uncharacterized protein n=1 Tax=Parapusillimonas granuli TaxID=380911 RepID=A0A853G7X3_9BURK|nr:hypothetical protein [Parapusillimonas granuli]MBB5215961.1 hypothetical protein [Parapusillimonas granuli]MEB2399356.1 hypothetical protein [Alcaligenaceae bacterium]NYT50741.1 hypothetical protein [Parapusillimonas granuli]